MLKPLTAKHIAKFATIENGKLFDGKTIMDVKEPADIEFVLTKKHRGLWIYSYDIEPYIQHAISNFKHKIISRKGDIIGCKIYFKDGKNSINLVQASYILPSRPPSLFAGLSFLYKKLNPGTNCKWTVGAFSMDLFRRHYQKDVLKGLPIYEESFVRESYAGGRIELLSKELKTGFSYDVNSMYGWAMLQDMPTGQAVYVQKRNPERIGFYSATVNQKHLNIPPLWKKINGALCYPADCFSGIFSGVELASAKEAGANIEIKFGIEWTAKKAIFKEFAENIFILKNDEIKYKSVLAKKMLVSLYGKFGIERQVEIIKKVSVKEYYASIKEGGPQNEQRQTVFAKTNFSKQKYILPYMASHITALCRTKLFSKIMEIENAGGHVAYCHTDSIFTDTQIVSGNKMGEWGFEGVVENAEFRAINTYKMELNGKIAIKAGGINADSVALAKYVAGKEIIIKKTCHDTKKIKEYSVKLQSNMFKRKFTPTGNSLPLTIGAILDNM